MKIYENFNEQTRRVSHKPVYNFWVSLPDSATGFKEYTHEGQKYIEGRKGTEYVLNFYNGSNQTVEIVVSVDGLSIVDGKPAGVESTGYVVRAYQTVKIPGWRINADRVAQFVFRPQGDKNDSTYVEALRSEGVNVDSANQGVIGCLVFREKEVPRQHYNSFLLNSVNISADGGYRSKGLGAARSFGASGQPFNAASTGDYDNLRYNTSQTTQDWFQPQSATSDAAYTASASVGTGFGEDRTYKTKNVDFKRHDNYNPDQTFVVMYDTITGLRRRGVPVDEKPNPLNNAFPNSPHLSNDGCRIPKNR